MLIPVHLSHHIGLSYQLTLALNGLIPDQMVSDPRGFGRWLHFLELLGIGYGSSGLCCDMCVVFFSGNFTSSMPLRNDILTVGKVYTFALLVSCLLNVQVPQALGFEPFP